MSHFILYKECVAVLTMLYKKAVQFHVLDLILSLTGQFTLS